MTNLIQTEPLLAIAMGIGLLVQVVRWIESLPDERIFAAEWRRPIMIVDEYGAEIGIRRPPPPQGSGGPSPQERQARLDEERHARNRRR